MTDEHRDLTAHVRGALAEALVAEAIYRRHADVVLHAPRHPGYDVSSEAGGLRVDAKVSVLVEADLDGNGTERAAEWDAGTRPDVLHESATHLGLVVLDDSLTALRLFEGGEAVLSGEVVAHGRVFLVPGDVARAEAQPVWSLGVVLEAARLLLKGPDAEFTPTTAVEDDRGHGRIERRTIRTAPADRTLFPGAHQVFRLRRETGGLDGDPTSKYGPNAGQHATTSQNYTVRTTVTFFEHGLANRPRR